VEAALSPNWSARVEYLFIELGGRPYAVTGTSNGFESSVLRLGVNYRF
jgi:outer membrane immunogenic protein